jgi:hypothetical protein
LVTASVSKQNTVALTIYQHLAAVNQVPLATNADSKFSLRPLDWLIDRVDVPAIGSAIASDSREIERD